MKQITNEEIKKIIDEAGEGAEGWYNLELAAMDREQPAITIFLQNHSELNENEMDTLHRTALLGWHIIKKILNRNKEINIDLLYEQFDKNYARYFNSILSVNEHDFTIAKKLYKPDNQIFLMDYLAEFLIKTIEDSGSQLTNEIICSLIIDIKSIIDCLVSDED